MNLKKSEITVVFPTHWVIIRIDFQSDYILVNLWKR